MSRSHKKITYNRLKNIAYFYLERFDASSRHLKEVLSRRVLKANFINNEDYPEAEKWIDDIVAELINLKFLDDKRYAFNKALSLYNSGCSFAMIRLKLKQAKVDENIIKSALDNIYAEDEDAELKAAIVFAKKKKLGSFASDNKKNDEKEYLKTLAKFARAGFSLNVAKRIIAGDV